MRLCIPAEAKGGFEDQVGYYFGRVHNYTIYNHMNNEGESILKTSSHIGRACQQYKYRGEVYGNGQNHHHLEGN